MAFDLVLTLLLASVAAYALAVLSAVAGFGGGVLLLPVFTGLFGLRVAMPVLTLTQISSNSSRVWRNRGDLGRHLISWFCLGAVPCAVAGALLLAVAPFASLQRLLGVFLIAVVVWAESDHNPADRAEPPSSPSAPPRDSGRRCSARSAH